MPRPSQRGQGLALQPYSPLEHLAVAKPLAASRLGALGVSLLRRQLGLELGPLDRRPRALAVALGVTLREPARPTGLLGRLVERAASVPKRALGLLLAAARLLQSHLGSLQVVPGALLGLLALGQPGRELPALGASRQRGVGALPRQPPDLPHRGVEALPVDGDGNPREPLGDPVEVIHQPRVREQALGDRAGVAPGLDQVEQAAGAVLRRGARRLRRSIPQKRAGGAVCTREPFPALADRADDRGAQPLAEHRRYGPLEPGPGLDHPGQRLVLALHGGRRQLGLDGGQLPGQGRPALGCLLRLGAGPLVHLGGLSQGGSDLVLGALQRLEGSLRRRSALLGHLSLAAQVLALLGGVGAQPLELGLELGDPRRLCCLVGLLVERIEPQLALPEGAAQVPLGQIEGLRSGPNALGGRTRLGELLAVAAPPLLSGREPLLDRRATRPHLLEALLDRVPRGADLGELRLGGRQLLLLGAEVVGDDLCSQLVRLPDELRCALGGLGLALQGAQVGASLPLDVVRTLEVVAGAVELELCAVAALAVLAEARGLLDQQAPVAGLRADDLLDLALADHRVGLAAHVRVGEGLHDVREAASSTVQPVLPVAVALDPAGDRDLRELAGRPALGVVDHDLDLGEAPRRLAIAAGEDHVPHLLAANRRGALLAERPEHRVGDVRLARAVRPHDHADARREGQPGTVGEGLEALQIDGLQIHRSRKGGRRRMLARRPDATAPRRGASPGRAGLPPARPPSCSSRSRHRARRPPPWRGPRSGGRVAGRPRWRPRS